MIAPNYTNGRGKPFPECLQIAMSERGWTVEDMAEQIKKPGGRTPYSRVRRWLAGETVPRYRLGRLLRSMFGWTYTELPLLHSESFPKDYPTPNDREMALLLCRAALEIHGSVGANMDYPDARQRVFRHEQRVYRRNWKMQQRAAVRRGK